MQSQAPISTAAIAQVKHEGINLTSVSAIPDTIRGLEVIQKLLSEVDHLKAVQENLEKYPKKIYAGNAQMNGDETKTFSEEDLKNAPTGWTERYIQIFSDKIKGHSTNTKGNWVLRYMYLI